MDADVVSTKFRVVVNENDTSIDSGELEKCEGNGAEVEVEENSGKRIAHRHRLFCPQVCDDETCCYPMRKELLETDEDSEPCRRYLELHAEHGDEYDNEDEEGESFDEEEEEHVSGYCSDPDHYDPTLRHYGADEHAYFRNMGL